MSRVRRISVLLGTTTILGIGAVALIDPSALHFRRAVPTARSIAHLIPCSKLPPEPLGYLAQLSVLPVATGGDALLSTTGSQRFALFPWNHAVPIAMAERRIRLALGTQQVGTVMNPPADPALRSCASDLTGNSTDHRLGMAALRTLVSNATLPATAASASALNGELTSMFVSSDPLNASDAIVTVDTPGTKTTPDPGMPGFRLGTVVAHVAIVNIHTSQVVAFGLAPW